MFSALRSVKFRLTLWYAFILTFLLSLFGFLMHAELSRALYHDADQNLSQEMRALESSLESHGGEFFGDDFLNLETVKGRIFPVLTAEQKQKLRKALAQWEKKEKRVGQSTFLLRLRGLDRASLISNLAGWEKQVIFPDFERDAAFMENGESFQLIHFHNKPIRLYYRIFRWKGRPLFVIQCGVSLRDLNAALQRLAFLIWVSIPGAVAVTCLVGWMLVKRAFRPIDSMIREARQIHAAYLKGRLPRTYVQDELDRLAETLNEMMDRIESSTRAVQDFSSDISHELKTPLAIIRGEIDLAFRRERSAESLMQTIKTIGGEVNELIGLVDDLLLLVRSDARQLRFEKKPVSLADLLTQVAERFRERLEGKKIQLSTKLHPEALVQGDDVYLKRLFMNLLDNALKFTPEEGSVHLELRRTDEEAVAEVRDNGIGIALELQSKVFSRFFRTDQARSFEGSGLGLNIAKAIADAHGAAIEIESKPGQGTCVRVRFPLPVA